MDKKTKLWIWVGAGCFVVEGLFIFLKIIYKWKASVLFWVSLIIILLVVVPTVFIQLSKKKIKKEDLPEKPSDFATDKIKEEAMKWILSDEYLSDNIVNMKAKTYVPKQESGNKVSFKIIIAQRYWNEDLILCATPSNKIDFQNTATPQLSAGLANGEIEIVEEEALNKFKQELDNAVANPIIMAEVPSFETDMLGQPRIVTKIVPLSHIQAQQEETQIKKEEKEEGVSE